MGLFGSEVIAFVQASQPKAWAQLVTRHGGEQTAREKFLKTVVAALDHRGEHAGVQRPGAFILGGTADMRIVGVPPCSDVFGQGDMEKRQRRQRLPAVGRGIGGAAGTIPAHLLLSKPTVAVDRRDC